MPVLEQGYEPYRGPLSAGRARFVAITGAALRRNRRWYVWVLLLLAWLFGSGMEFFMMFLVYALPAMGVRDGPGGSDAYLQAFVNHPNLYPDLMASQVFWALALATMVGAGEVAEDFRTGALTFYLGRPVTRLDYVLGKAAAVSLAVLAVTLVPTLLLFTLQALFEGSFDWLREHARVPFAACGAALLECVFASGFVLGLSSFVRRRRWATVTVVAILVGLTAVAGALAPARGWTSDREQQRASQAVREADTPEERKAALRRLSDSLDPLGSGSEMAEWRALAPGALLAACGRDLFGNPRPGNFPPGRHWVLALGVPAILLGVLGRRVRAVEVVS
jgi:ABC-type transport system involved in multi-copper enzyme maturation permease subunit